MDSGCPWLQNNTWKLTERNVEHCTLTDLRQPFPVIQLKAIAVILESPFGYLRDGSVIFLGRLKKAHLDFLEVRQTWERRDLGDGGCTV